MKGSLHVNWDAIIICKKGAIHRTEIERPFLAAKSFNANLVQFLTPYHVIISNVHVSSFACTISHVHGRASKTVLRARNLEKLSFMKACIDMLNVALKVFKVCDKGTRATPIQKDVQLSLLSTLLTL